MTCYAYHFIPALFAQHGIVRLSLPFLVDKTPHFSALYHSVPLGVEQHIGGNDQVQNMSDLSDSRLHSIGQGDCGVIVKILAMGNCLQHVSSGKSNQKLFVFYFFRIVNVDKIEKLTNFIPVIYTLG
jgi:hypothetical protein